MRRKKQFQRIDKRLSFIERERECYTVLFDSGKTKLLASFYFAEAAARERFSASPTKRVFAVPAKDPASVERILEKTGKKSLDGYLRTGKVLEKPVFNEMGVVVTKLDR